MKYNIKNNNFFLIIDNNEIALPFVTIKIDEIYEQNLSKNYGAFTRYSTERYITLSTIRDNPRITTKEIPMTSNEKDLYKLYEIMVRLQEIMNDINQKEQRIHKERVVFNRSVSDSEYRELMDARNKLNNFIKLNKDITLDIEFSLCTIPECTIGLNGLC